MKRLLVIVPAVMLLMWLVGCMATPSEMGALVSTIHDATADNFVSPDETARIIAHLPAPGFDWRQAGEIAGSIALSLLGVKLLPDRHLKSPFDKSPSQIA